MAITKIQSESMNLADTYAFTGTVTGIPSGVEMADQFNLTNTLASMANGTATLISSDIARVNSDGFGQLGTGMTESSGIFTFPLTGIYLIMYPSWSWLGN